MRPTEAAKLPGNCDYCLPIVEFGKITSFYCQRSMVGGPRGTYDEPCTKQDSEECYQALEMRRPPVFRGI